MELKLLVGFYVLRKKVLLEYIILKITENNRMILEKVQQKKGKVQQFMERIHVHKSIL